MVGHVSADLPEMRGKGIVFLAEEQFYAVPYLLGGPSFRGN